MTMKLWRSSKVRRRHDLVYINTDEWMMFKHYLLVNVTSKKPNKS